MTKIIVCQRGARRRYMVATLLYRAGMLSALYTDSSLFSILGKLGAIIPNCLKNQRIRKLLNREIIDIPKELIFSSDNLFFQSLFNKQLDMSKQYIKWGLQDSDAIYSFYGEDKPFLYYAKKRNKIIIVDVMCHPFLNQIYANDGKITKDYPYDIKKLEQENINQIKHSQEIFDLADYLIAPSNWVREGILNISLKYENKIKTIPYGSSIDYTGQDSTPKVGRILFVGHGVFSKGLHHLGFVAPKIKELIPNSELRIIGISTKESEYIENKNLLHFLGNLPLAKMKDEYLNADVLIMPSLSEGQSGAVLEALAAGVPVVITKQSGVDITNGREGFIFDSSDYENIPELLDLIINNRNIRNEMSIQAKELSKQFSLNSWQNRLTEFITSI